jgi:hypothetical protein
MSLDTPPQNKMMTNPPAKKEYHFASTAEHLAEVVYAASIQEAEQTYHRVKRLIITPVAVEPGSTADTSKIRPAQSTDAAVPTTEEQGVL